MPRPNQSAAIIESADDAIVCNDREGRITSWNPAAERMLGFTAADVIGRDISLLFPPEGQRDEAAALLRVLSGEGATSAVSACSSPAMGSASSCR